MNKITQFEDLSNELCLEIFDYLHALDLFMSFSSLNQRISSILFSAQLHVVISKFHCQYQMKFLSSHLTHHVDQVISVSLEDQLRDYSSVISFIFDQHIFINLRSCKFYHIHPSFNLHIVIQRLQNLTKLVSFRIFHSKNIPLSHLIKQDISRTILQHKYFKLRSIDLSFHYDYPSLVANIALNLKVTSLHMIFDGSIHTLSIYSFLPILRHYRALRLLRIAIFNETNLNTQQPILPTLPAPYEDNPPISHSIRTFDLTIRAICSFQLLNFILRCMPNLRRLILSIIYLSSVPFCWRNLFDGYRWQQILTTNTPSLDIFDIFILVKAINLVPNIDTALKSFDYFANKYDDWYVAIHRSPLHRNDQTPRICLRGFRRLKRIRFLNSTQVRIVLGMQNLPMTTIVDVQHHLFYSDINNLHINIPVKRIVFDTQSPSRLFNNIDSLTIELDSSTLSFWQDMGDLFNICVNVAEIDQYERAEKIANLVDLTGITKLEIQPKDDTSHLYFLQNILIASSRLIHLKISNRLIFSPILCDNASLTPVFHRLQSLYLVADFFGLPLIHASKIIEHFPSLIHLEFEIYFAHLCKLLLDILFDGLPKLIHLKIHFRKNKLLGDWSCLIDYFIERRRQAFPDHPCNKEEVAVNIDEKIIDIYFSGCPICAKI